MILTDEGSARAYVAELCDAAAIERIEALIAALRVENERQNLVAQATLESVWLRHIADSAQLLSHVPRETGPWLDLGTGAGFPGLVITALRPEMPVFLVESRGRRIEWLAGQVESLELPNCTVIGHRLEMVESFDAGVISARAFASLPRLIELSARFSTAHTRWVLPKGRSAAQEVQELPKRIRPMFHVEQSLTDVESGIIVGEGKMETRK